MVQGPRRIMRTILAVMLLCTAFAFGEVHAQPKVPSSAEPTAEDIARGKALTEAGDCASCHTADAAKPFAGGKRIDTPFGGIYSPNLTPDARPAWAPGATTNSTARCDLASRATARAITRPSPIRISQN